MNTYEDESCTAAPGVMGTLSCHYYPQCGCGGVIDDADRNESDYNSWRTSDKLLFELPEHKWLKIPFVKKNGLVFTTKDDESYLMTTVVPFKFVDGKYLVVHKPSMKELGIKRLKDLFEAYNEWPRK